MMKKSEAMFGVARVPLDAIAVMLALLAAYMFRVNNVDLIPGVQLLEPATTLPALHVYIPRFIGLSILMFITFAAFLRLYALKNTLSAWSEIGRILLAAILWLVGVMAWYFLVRKQLFYSRILLLHSAVLMALFVITLRVIVVLMQRRLLRAGIGVRAVVSIGRKKLASAARGVLARDPHYAYLGHLKDLEQLKDMQSDVDPDLVLQTDPDPASDATAELIEYCRSNHIGYAFLPPVFADVPHLLSVERLGLLPMIRFQPTPLDGWGRVIKRIFDLVVSILLIALLIPVWVIIALLIVIDSGRPVFYISKRVGETGKTRIGVIKFRSMVKDADARKEELIELNHRRDGPLFKVKNDPRITRIGKILRNWTIDELPQLFNVCAGSMSLVGPRPHLPSEVQLYTSYQRRVFAVRPGMTGLAQVSGRSDLSFDEEVAMDLKYIEEWSLLLDIWILWRTFIVMLSRKGAD